MAEKIFLEKNRNVESINKDSKVNVNLTQKARLLPFNNLSDTLNLAELFDTERDACNDYRIILTVNPICTNVLYNMLTEVVKDEGGPGCVSLVGDNVIARPSSKVTNTTVLNRLQAIRDTEYSHPEAGGFVYHCGLDIFNNHMLRANGFVHINKISSGGDNASEKVFNTLWDYQRDCDGNKIVEHITDTPNINTNGSTTEMHVYRIDNVLTFAEAFDKHMTEKNGWFGFNNVGFIDIPNGANGTISVNKIMNNNKACEFIDMYPDRSLYSFIPKVNKIRRRIEKNWDYCITYPYESDYNMLTSLMAIDVNGSKQTCMNSLKAHVTTGKTQNGYKVYVFKTTIKHNLKNGDTVTLTNTHGDKLNITISGIGDVDGTDNEHTFRIYENQVTIGIFNDCVWVRKLSNSTGCKYYLRKFKKILNADGSELNSNIGKLAFGENIYGDRVAEVIFTDNINVSGLRDNLGRKLSEIYFTVVKTNRGHDLWYDNNVFGDSRIEFSHCFGKVTSGLELFGDETDYNIRKLHNVGSSVPKKLEDDIIEDKKEWFYGDIVEFDPSTNSETILEKVYHRFNTAQRETTNQAYKDIRYDKLERDDYDAGVVISNTIRSGFSINTAETINSGYSITQKEGYYYQPHHRIKIREISDTVNTQIGAVIADYLEPDMDRNAYSVRTDDNQITHFIEITTTYDYGYMVGDLFGIYNSSKMELLWGVVDSYTDNGDSFHLKMEVNKKIELSDLNAGRYTIALTDGSVPTYASYIPEEQKFVWRDVLNPSEVTSDNPLSEIMFTNGVNYIHDNINFYVKRQDPFGTNGLLINPEDIDAQGRNRNPLTKYKKFGFEFNASQLLYLAIDAQNACL